MALTADTIYPVEESIYNELPVKASTKIYEGAVVSMSSGYAKGYAGTDTIFVGFAVRQADNSSGADGAITVKVRKDQHYRVVTLSSAAVTDVGAALYASDSGTFTKTSTSNLKVGTIARLAGTDLVCVRVETAC